jgi:hypothetical protein
VLQILKRKAAPLPPWRQQGGEEIYLLKSISYKILQKNLIAFLIQLNVLENIAFFLINLKLNLTNL